MHVDLPSEVIAAALEGSSAPAATRYEINVSASGSTTHCIQSASRKFMEVKEVLICIGQVLYGVSTLLFGPYGSHHKSYSIEVDFSVSCHGALLRKLPDVYLCGELGIT